MANIAVAGDVDPAVSDIFSLSDQQLSDKLEFVQEIGFGNWGSVWSCRSKTGTPAETRRKLAVKLVHRAKTATTAARVRSLWNEMKVVRTLKDDPHPSIIHFHSFIITPSYALVTMEYLPRLIPVEVKEAKAKVWFASLISAIAHLHTRGIVHNDIKPANILLSRHDKPVLVDFGFAEKYDFEPAQPSDSFSSSSSSLDNNAASKVPFLSNLAYGTPEYLSPERARGLAHDCRKSDVWSLGVTFFEILVGRTPFEIDEGEEFASKEDLEKYWDRTVKGEWVGQWKMSSVLETLLRKMIKPDAERRISAVVAMKDDFFLPSLDDETSSPLRDVKKKRVIESTLPCELPSAPASVVLHGAARVKLNALQNLIGKRSSVSLKTQTPKKGKRSEKENKDADATPTHSAHNTITKSISRSFFPSHLRSKSKSRSQSQFDVTVTTQFFTPPTSPAEKAPPLPPVPRSPPPPPPAYSLSAKTRLQTSMQLLQSLAAPSTSSLALSISSSTRESVPPSPSEVPVPTPPSAPAPISAPAPRPEITPASASVATLSPATILAVAAQTPGPPLILSPAPRPTSVVPSTRKSAKPFTVAPAVLAPSTPAKSKRSTALRPKFGGPATPKSDVKIKPILSPPPASRSGKENAAISGTAVDANGKATKALKVKHRNSRVHLGSTPAWVAPSPTKKPLVSKKDIKLAVKKVEEVKVSNPSHAPVKQIGETPRSPAAESGFSSFKHSLRNSIDKTAERWVKVSSAASRGRKSRKSATDLRDSWGDFERVAPTAVAASNLSMVIDEPSVDHTADGRNKSEDSQDSQDSQNSQDSQDRLTMWVKNVEKVVEDTRSDFLRQANNPAMSSRTLASRASAQLRASVVVELPRLSTASRMSNGITSLPPPRRRATLSSAPSQRRSPSSDTQHHAKSQSVLDLGRTISPNGLQPQEPESRRLSAILGASERHILLAGAPVTNVSLVVEEERSSTESDPLIPKIELDTSFASDASFVKIPRTSTPASFASNAPPTRSLSLNMLKSHWSPDTTLGSTDPMSVAGKTTLSRSSSVRAAASVAPPPNTPPITDPIGVEQEGVYDRFLMSTASVVRIGKGYQSGNTIRRSSKLYGPQQPIYLENPYNPTVITSSGGITNSQRRRSFFGTLRGREQTEHANTTYDNDFAPAGELRRSGSEALLNRNIVEASKPKETNHRSDTLSRRVKRAFMRVVSSPVAARAVITA